MRKGLFLISFFIFTLSCSYDGRKVINSIPDEAPDEDGVTDILCGNGIVDEGEVCDRTSVKCTALDPEKYRDGFAVCKKECTGYDVSGCVEVYSCGNSIVEPGEVCDGNFKSCSEIDPDQYVTGFAPCFKYCNGWDESKCRNYNVCGNGFLEKLEVCEIGDETDCSKLDSALFSSGKAKCNDSCNGWIYSECRLNQCDEIDCGSVSIKVAGTDYEFICGECSGGDICTSFNKCEFPCSDSRCGDVGIVDNLGGYHKFECRKCPAMQYCDIDNQCKNACYDMACGNDHGINCGKCPDGYYCGPYPTRCKPMPKIEFTEIPEGSFFMGCNEHVDNACSDAEKPGHIVNLSDYMIGVYEITVRDYEYCIDAGFCGYDESGVLHYKTYINNFRCNIGSYRDPDHPVNCVNYYGAEAFCKFIGGTLPTEAQWEKAARGGCEFYEDCEKETAKYPWGNEIATCDTAVMMDALSGISGCETGGTMSSGSKPAGMSQYGLFDMSGNVWEWTADWFDEGYFYYSPENDPQGPDSGRDKVLKGGSCNFSSNALRPSYRYNVYPNVHYTYSGFRCVKAVE
jgi:formylglycine-generating enzyme required for sulfatase activity